MGKTVNDQGISTRKRMEWAMNSLPSGRKREMRHTREKSREIDIESRFGATLALVCVRLSRYRYNLGRTFLRLMCRACRYDRLDTLHVIHERQRAGKSKPVLKYFMKCLSMA